MSTSETPVGPSSKSPFKAENHYVPEFYLRRWGDEDQRIWTYRTLVSHERVPLWKLYSLGGIAKHRHLYSHLAYGVMSDAVEDWLAEEVDTPAARVLARIDSRERLTAADWDVLLRFFAASQARTPSYLVRRQPVWDRTLPELIDSTLKRAAAEIDSGLPHLLRDGAKLGEGIVEPPIEVRIRNNEGGGGGQIEAMVLTGRRLWQAEITRMVTHSYRRLHDLRWSILVAPDGVTWPTSDDPAVVVRLDQEGRATFGDGWGVPGTVLFLPLSPRYLLQGHLRWKSQSRYDEISHDGAKFARWCIARNALRLVFASHQDAEVVDNRRRRVDEKAFQHERNEWVKWHEEQSNAERDLESDRPWPTARTG